MQVNVTHLQDRAILLRAIRDHFDQRGFLEVQPPCLGSDCVVDAHLDPIRVPAQELGIGNVQLPPHLILQTSPESAMKRMLAAGAPSIYSLGPVFRSGELGALHNPEFTMLEWYRIGQTVHEAMDFLGELVCTMLDKANFHRVSYRDCFGQYAGIDPIDANLQQLIDVVEKVDKSIGKTLSNDRDGMLDVIMSELVQPNLGFDHPLIVNDYPLSQAALARPSADDPECAARFEIFVDGVELANGYDELTDADEFLRRAIEQNEKRVAMGKPTLLDRSRLHHAMDSGMPESCGVALGFDRLLMLRVGAKSISDVIPITIARC